MELVLLIVAVAVAIVVLARSPVSRSIGQAEEQRLRSWVPSTDPARQMRRNDPPGGGLL